MSRNMRIDLSGGNGTVAQQRLDIAYIHPSLQKRSGKRMWKHMRCHVIGCTDSI